MDQIFEFISNHLLLFIAFSILVMTLLITENKRLGKSVSIAMATQLINKEGGIVIDLRPQAEYREGHILNALNIPSSTLTTQLDELSKYKDTPLILVCKTGQQTGTASKILKKANFSNTLRMQGGMAEWLATSLPLVKS